LTADKEDLRDALRKTAQVSHSPALQINVTHAEPPSPDWLRLLSGRALTASEVESGIAIPRRLRTIEGDVDLADIPSWFQQHRGSTLLLTAEAGEGKSTYLSLLKETMGASAIMLTWSPDHDLRIDEVQDAADTARSFLNSRVAAFDTDSLPVIVLAELRPALDEETAGRVLSILNEHEVRGGEAIFLIAGRPSVINSLIPTPFGVEHCSLAPIDASDASALCAHLQRAYSAITNSMSEDYFFKLFPNLPNFLQLSPTDQASYFLAPRQPLIVGFLKAIYGNDFINRLVDEYKTMKNLADQHAYLHVCLATMSGITLPERFLRSLAPNAALDARSNYDPWVRTDDDEHIARHPIIAQTVLERSDVFTALESCFEDLVGLSRQQPNSLQLLFDIVNGVAHMRALSTTNTSIPGRIRGRLTNALISDPDLPGRVYAESNSAARLFSWGSLLRSLLPAKPTEQYVPVYEVAVKILERAFALARDADRTLAERVEYALDCAVRDLTLATGDTESIQEREYRIKRWRDFVGKDWVGPKFYADLFYAAKKLAHELTFDTSVLRDSDSLYWAYLISGIAYQYLFATGSELVIKARSTYGDLFNRHMYYALPARHVDVWKEIWQIAKALRTFPVPGVMYAQSLLDPPSRQSDKDEAVKVLQEVIDKFHADPAALRLLAKEASASRTDLVPSLKEKVSERIAHTTESSFYLGILYSAAALLEEDASIRRGYLERSVEEFSKAQWNRGDWDAVGFMWVEACAELKRLGSKTAGCRMLEGVRKKAQRMR
jgi:tetratricopeptide (TPR) repeat protein